MTKKCRLCEKVRELEDSHILPKFIYKYQKKTSPTGYVRGTENPNLIVRDGEKTPFLCGECEDLFSKWETKFATDIFHPYQNDSKKEFLYEEWLTKYLASVSFRVLVYIYEESKLNYFSQEMLKYVDGAINNLRIYLLGETQHPGSQRQLLLLFDNLDPNGTNPYPENYNLYLNRAIRYDVLTTDESSFIYVKYLKFLQLCPIYLSSNKGWRTARININKGILKQKDHELPDYIVKEWIKDSELISKSKLKVSEKQSGIIKTRIYKDIDKIINSDLGKSSMIDSLGSRK